jgi:hypothetical protein
VDAEAPLTNGAKADGEVVWSWRPVLFLVPPKYTKAAWLKDFFDFPETTQSLAFLAGLFFVS